MIFIEYINSLDRSAPKSNLLNSKLRLLKVLYKKNSQSASGLGNELGLSIPTITSMLTNFIKDGYVCKVGIGKSSGGRKPLLYQLKSDVGYFVTIFMNIHEAQIIVYDFQNRAIEKPERLQCQIADGMQALEQIAKRVNQILERNGIHSSKVVGTCIAMPGLINHQKGTNLTYFSEESDQLTQKLNSIFPSNVWIENDAKAVAIGEKHFGVAKNVSDVVTVEIDYGLGLGMILNGSLYRGADGYAGELGHVQMPDNNTICKCGKIGCLEAVLNSSFFIGKTKTEMPNFPTSILFSKATITVEDIINSANLNDPLSIKMLDWYGRKLAVACGLIIQIINPSLLVICGKFSLAGEYLLCPLLQELGTICSAEMLMNTKVALSETHTKSANLGGITIIADKIFQ